MKPSWLTKEILQKNGRDSSVKIHEKYLKLYATNPKTCIECNKELEYKKRINTFCNHTCAAKYLNRKFPKKVKTKQWAVCKVCLNPVSSYSAKYCSNECKLSFKNNQSFDKISRRDKRDRILEEQNYTCIICKNCIWNGYSIPLEIDHIDGNRKNEIRENLRAICPNCHAFTPTYKAKNIRAIFTEQQIIEALKNSTSIYKAMLLMGMSPQRNCYRRCRAILKKYNIVLLKK